MGRLISEILLFGDAGVTTNVNGSDFRIQVPERMRGDAIYSVFVWNSTDDFDSGTVTIQVSPDGTNYFTARDVNANLATFTQSGHMNLILNADVVRAMTTGIAGLPPPAIFATVI